MKIKALVIAGALALTPLSGMAFGVLPWDYFQNDNNIIMTGGVSGHYVDGYNIPRDIFLVGDSYRTVEKEKVVVYDD